MYGGGQKSGHADTWPTHDAPARVHRPPTSSSSDRYTRQRRRRHVARSTHTSLPRQPIETSTPSTTLTNHDDGGMWHCGGVSGGRQGPPPLYLRQNFLQCFLNFRLLVFMYNSLLYSHLLFISCLHINTLHACYWRVCMCVGRYLPPFCKENLLFIQRKSGS